MESFTNWFSTRPATALSPGRYYVSVPAFSMDAGTWEGSSLCIGQFNYSADSNFWLIASLITKPTAANYMLCIRWRRGDTVYRYRLWDDARFLGPDIAKYVSQLVGKYFVIEVWSFENEATPLSVLALNLVTSDSVPVDSLDSLSNTSIATGAEFTSISNTNVNPTADSTCGFWGEIEFPNFTYSGSSPFTNAAAVWLRTNGTGLDSNAFVMDRGEVLTAGAYPSFCEEKQPLDLTYNNAAGSLRQDASPYQGLASTFVITILFCLKAVPGGSVRLFTMDEFDLGADLIKVDVDANLALTLTAFGSIAANAVLPYGVGIWQCLTIKVTNTNASLVLDNGYVASNSSFWPGGTIRYTKLQIGGGAASAPIYLGGLYIATAGSYTTAVLANIVQFTKFSYLGALPLPLTFETDSAWTDNTDYEDFT